LTVGDLDGDIGTLCPKNVRKSWTVQGMSGKKSFEFCFGMKNELPVVLLSPGVESVNHPSAKKGSKSAESRQVKFMA
jgi:hypothetical protein